jgi:hypothetical protein
MDHPVYEGLRSSWTRWSRLPIWPQVDIHEQAWMGEGPSVSESSPPHLLLLLIIYLLMGKMLTLFTDLATSSSTPTKVNPILAKTAKSCVGTLTSSLRDVSSQAEP